MSITVLDQYINVKRKIKDDKNGYNKSQASHPLRNLFFPFRESTSKMQICPLEEIPKKVGKRLNKEESS